ncbi:MAG: hypothetical protein ETSY1_12025 [Candidatus Entotheonella factor]|uniref:Uncharacterized protein n=1 Tax=Entotheonella factor TaxID=1429438 RepID=W4LQQ7_ENTF1|nr:hypothetical protein [Candidatus Entotheonella palauensis]ETX00220.1 MAG: hypothetical protein ETSY1_12025 [Candidatus Entotheonella factor]
MQTQRQVRYIPQRIVTWWHGPAVRAWMARLTMRVEQALEKAAQGG